MMNASKQEVVVVGGGFVGCLAAIMLAKLGIHVNVIEAKTITPAPSTDPRGIALNYASCELLKQLTLWPELSKKSMPIKTVHVSAKRAFSKVRFHAEDRGLEYLACVIEGTHLLNVLNEHAKQHEYIQWHQPETVQAIEYSDNHIKTTLKSGKHLSSHLLLAADGQHSTSRQLLGIQTSNKTTEHALLTNVTLDQSHQHIAYERFTPEGTIALLPLTSDQCKLVITGSEPQINHWQHLSEESFLQTLQQTFGAFAGKFIAISKRIHYPLTELTVAQQARSRAILLGNAAHALHPIAAQGLNLAIRDLTVLRDLIKTSMSTQQDIGRDELLASYERQIKMTQTKIMKLTKLLSKMRGGFINRSALALVANCPILKSAIETQALGI